MGAYISERKNWQISGRKLRFSIAIHFISRIQQGENNVRAQVTLLKMRCDHWCQPLLKTREVREDDIHNVQDSYGLSTAKTIALKIEVTRDLQKIENSSSISLIF